jgi:trimeric autotransporter adhesin
VLGFSSSSGARLVAFPSIGSGSVSALIDDGRGGWYVGGSFDRIGGVACANLAHVTAAMAVDRGFCPRPDQAVYALARSGSTLCVGGAFMRIGGTRRPWLAAVDATSGRVSSWKPVLDGPVEGMAVRNPTVYVLGEFGAVDGKPRFSLAAIDARTGAVTGWNPHAPEGSHGQPVVDSIAATSAAVYVGGIFDQIGGKKIVGLAALDPTTGKATAFAPAGNPWTVEALAVAGGRLYAGGFTHSGGYLAAYDAATGKAVPWKPHADPGGIDALTVGNSRVYAAGARLEAFDVGTGRQVVWTPPLPNQRVRALAFSGRTVAAGGQFTGAGGVTREGLAAIDLTTGQPTGWYPRASTTDRSPTAISAITVSGSTVYIGGAFARVDGKPRADVASVDAATGRVTAWAPQITSDQVLAIGLGGSNVYVGGFGVASSYDTSGKLRWNSPPGGISASVNAIAVGGGTVYLGGSFDVIGGATRHALVAVDARNGSTTSWNPRVSEKDGTEEVSVLALSGSTLFVGGSFDSAAGAKRNLLASFDTKTGKLTDWAPKPGDIVHVYALAVTPGAVYAAGDGGALAFDPKNGATLGWHPSVGVGGNIPAPFAHAIAVAGSTVYIGDEAGLESFSR